MNAVDGYVAVESVLEELKFRREIDLLTLRWLATRLVEECVGGLHLLHFV